MLFVYKIDITLKNTNYFFFLFVFYKVDSLSNFYIIMLYCVILFVFDF